MNRFLVVGALLAAVSQMASAALVDQSLVQFGRSKGGSHVVIVELQTPQSTTFPHRYNRAEVAAFLKARTNRAAGALQGYVDSQNLQNEVELIGKHWLTNSLALRVTPAGLRGLAQSDLVVKIYDDRLINQEPVHKGVLRQNMMSQMHARTATQAASDPYDYAEMGLDQVRKNFPNINGSGVTIGSVDTGVDGTHPALQGKIPLFYDGKLGKVGTPVDYDEHGTHTAGTMVGGDGVNIKIGIAPGAKLIVAGALQDYDQMLKGMQFMLDPGSNGGTGLPRAVNNSWNCGGAPDVTLFYKGISAWDAAGILPVFSAGNAGPDAGSITPPHEHPLAFATGATEQGGKIADYSSRGPGDFQGQSTQKPDLTAPGTDIVSSLPGGQYGQMSGTSMATPHVTGTVALLLQANPTLNPAQLRAILSSTASARDVNGNPSSTRGWNPIYGNGKLNAMAAVVMATKTSTERFMHNALGAQNLFDTILGSPQEMALQNAIAQGSIAESELTDADFESPFADDPAHPGFIDGNTL